MPRVFPETEELAPRFWVYCAAVVVLSVFSTVACSWVYLRISCVRGSPLWLALSPLQRVSARVRKEISAVESNQSVLMRLTAITCVAYAMLSIAMLIASLQLLFDGFCFPMGALVGYGGFASTLLHGIAAPRVYYTIVVQRTHMSKVSRELRWWVLICVCPLPVICVLIVVDLIFLEHWWNFYCVTASSQRSSGTTLRAVTIFVACTIVYQFYVSRAVNARLRLGSRKKSRRRNRLVSQQATAAQTSTSSSSTTDSRGDTSTTHNNNNNNNNNNNPAAAASSNNNRSSNNTARLRDTTSADMMRRLRFSNAVYVVLWMCVLLSDILRLVISPIFKKEGTKDEVRIIIPMMLSTVGAAYATVASASDSRLRRILDSFGFILQFISPRIKRSTPGETEALIHEVERDALIEASLRDDDLEGVAAVEDEPPNIERTLMVTTLNCAEAQSLRALLVVVDSSSTKAPSGVSPAPPVQRRVHALLEPPGSPRGSANLQVPPFSDQYLAEAPPRSVGANHSRGLKNPMKPLEKMGQQLRNSHHREPMAVDEEVSEAITHWLPSGYDIYAVGVQECMCWDELRSAILKTLNKQHRGLMDGGSMEEVEGSSYVCVTRASIGSRHIKGHIGIAVFARRRDVESAYVVIGDESGPRKTDDAKDFTNAVAHVPLGTKVGFGRSPNKGCVGVRVRVGDAHLLFLCAHLPADASGRARRVHRNACAAASLRKAGQQLTSSTDDDAFAGAHYVSATHTFFMGDLNYRATPPNLEHAAEGTLKNVARALRSPVGSEEAARQWKLATLNDELLRERKQGHALSTFDELPLCFAPTFRRKMGKQGRLVLTEATTVEDLCDAYTLYKDEGGFGGNADPDYDGYYAPVAAAAMNATTASAGKLLSNKAKLVVDSAASAVKAVGGGSALPRPPFQPPTVVTGLPRNTNQSSGEASPRSPPPRSPQAFFSALRRVSTTEAVRTDMPPSPPPMSFKHDEELDDESQQHRRQLGASFFPTTFDDEPAPPPTTAASEYEFALERARERLRVAPDLNKHGFDGAAAAAAFAGLRSPSWTDRILVHSLPRAKSELALAEYTSIENVSTSDHRPVRLSCTLHQPQARQRLLDFAKDERFAESHFGELHVTLDKLSADELAWSDRADIIIEEDEDDEDEDEEDFDERRRRRRNEGVVVAPEEEDEVKLEIFDDEDDSSEEEEEVETLVFATRVPFRRQRRQTAPSPTCPRFLPPKTLSLPEVLSEDEQDEPPPRVRGDNEYHHPSNIEDLEAKEEEEEEEEEADLELGKSEVAVEESSPVVSGHRPLGYTFEENLSLNKRSSVRALEYKGESKVIERVSLYFPHSVEDAFRRKRQMDECAAALQHPTRKELKTRLMDAKLREKAKRAPWAKRMVSVRAHNVHHGLARHALVGLETYNTRSERFESSAKDKSGSKAAPPKFKTIAYALVPLPDQAPPSSASFRVPLNYCGHVLGYLQGRVSVALPDDSTVHGGHGNISHGNTNKLRRHHQHLEHLERQKQEQQNQNRMENDDDNTVRPPREVASPPSSRPRRVLSPISSWGRRITSPSSPPFNFASTSAGGASSPSSRGRRTKSPSPPPSSPRTKPAALAKSSQRHPRRQNQAGAPTRTPTPPPRPPATAPPAPDPEPEVDSDSDSEPEGDL